MAFQLSPGINVSEIDLTNAVPAVATNEGAFVGVFRWGPTNERVLVSSEVDLVAKFGKPYKSGDWSNQESFYSAANFLGYSNALYVTRAVVTGANTAQSASNNAVFSAKYPGELGNSLRVITCDDSNTAFFDANGAPGGATEQETSGLTLTRGTFTGVINGEEPGTGAATTLTIDTSDANVVNLTESAANGVPANAFKVDGHGLVNGEDVIYTVGADGNAVIDPLVSGGEYYVIKLDNDTFQLAATKAAATGGTAIDLSGTQTGMSTNATIAPTRAGTTIDTYPFVVGGIIVVGDDEGTELEIASISAYDSENNQVTLTFKQKYWGDSTGSSPLGYGYKWEGSKYFDKKPDADRFHIAVIDELGEFTGTPGSLLEAYPNLSTSEGAKSFDNSSAYMVDVLDLNSRYVKFIDGKGDEDSDLAGIAGLVNETMEGGSDGASGDGDSNALSGILRGWDLYKSPDEVDVSLLVTGPADTTIQNYVMDNIAETRKDCVAFVSPTKDDVTAQAIVDYAADLSGSSYSVMDSGYKYQYDKYNDNYVWVPLNADVAGTCARTDTERDPWFSPAGYSRGQLKNVIKLKLNPNKTQRDLLYSNNINPVIIEPGQGAILFGDKTMQRNPSAFDRINVRRLFIVLEKAIALASKSTLFEFNDEFTRATFRNMIEPFLRDVQGRRGIYDFKVVCDETNNTGQVIDTNQFIGDIYIKPARSINFIQLNFVAVRTGVEFNEIIGQ